MLHIVLALLKIIGIVLASLLGLLILLILLVLFVPIRYGLKADNLNGFKAEGKVSWLFRLLYIQMTYLDEKFVIRLRLFGKIFYDSSRTEENKSKLKKEKTKSGKVLKKIDTREKVIKEKAQEESKKSGLKVNQSQGSTENETKIIKPAPNKTIIKKEPELNVVQLPDNVSDSNYEDSTDNQNSSKNKGDKSKHVLEKLKGFYNFIKAFFLNLKKGLYNLKNRLQNLWQTVRNLREKWEKVKAFLADEVNKSALLLTFRSIKKFLKHLRPTKLLLDLEFGTGDPCTTGQALGALAVVYSFYGNSLHIVPNFEEEILKGSINCIGRIRICTLLVIGLQLVFDKNFRNLLKNVKTLKEDL